MLLNKNDSTETHTRESSWLVDWTTDLYPLYNGSSEAWYVRIFEGILSYSTHCKYPLTHPENFKKYKQKVS